MYAYTCCLFVSIFIRGSTEIVFFFILDEWLSKHALKTYSLGYLKYET